MFTIDSKNFIPENELLFSFTRSSGPGGQNVNKVSSKAILHWSIENNKSLSSDVKKRFREKFYNKINSLGELVLACDSSRDRQRNIDQCFLRLKKMILQVATPPKIRKKTKPSKASKEKRIQGKKIKADLKKQRKKPIY